MKYLILLLISFNCLASSMTDIVSERVLASDESIAVTFSSIAVDLNQYRGISISATSSSTAAISGTLKLQASDDFTPRSSIVNWVDIPGSSSSVTGNDTVLWNIVDPYYRWIRIYYTPVSGSGILDASYNVKDFSNEK